MSKPLPRTWETMERHIDYPIAWEAEKVVCSEREVNETCKEKQRWVCNSILS